MLSIDPDDQDDEDLDSSRTAAGSAAKNPGGQAPAPGADLNSSGNEPQLDADGNPIPNANPQNSGENAVATPKVG